MVEGEAGKTKEKSMTEKVETVFKSRILPAAVTVFVYSVALFWSLFVVLRLLKRFATDPRKLIYAEKRPLPPKVLNDPQYGNHSYIQLPHVKLHYVEAGDKSKPLMLLVHGFPEFWYCWRHQIKEFSKDYWTVAFDMRGYGDSEKPQNVKYYHIKYLVDDVKNLIEGLGREKAILVSHDWGGIISWYVSIKYPEMVDKLVVLNAPYPAAFSKVLWSNLGQFMKSWYMFFFQLPWLPELLLSANDMSIFKQFFKSKKNGSVLKEDDVEAYKFTFGKSGAMFAAVAIYRANFASLSKRPKPIANTEYPKALLIFGDDDVALDVKTAELSKKMYPNLTTDIISGACHFVQQDEPEVVNSKIREFLSS